MYKKILFGVLLIFFLQSIFLFIVNLQNRQTIKSLASSETTIYFSPSSSFFDPIKIRTNDQLSLDIMLNPGSNKISTVKLAISYDPTKLQAIGNNTLIINNSVFPTILEGPVVDDEKGKILATLSVGVDPGLAVTTATKIGTVNLATLNKTDTINAVISFDTATQAYSVAPADHAFENVVSTAIPAYVAVGNFEPSPTIPPPATPVPTAVVIDPSESLPPVDSDQATLAFNVLLHGIGTRTDNQTTHELALNNKNPAHPKKIIHVSLYDASNNLVTTKDGVIIYDANASLFGGIVGLGTDIPAGTYTVKIKTEGYLERQIPSTWQISSSTRLTMPTVSLFVGDLNNDDAINIFDFNILAGCYENDTPDEFCDSQSRRLADLNDDNFVTRNDYQLFINELYAQNEN